jgi:hypothetical protein
MNRKPIAVLYPTDKSARQDGIRHFSTRRGVEHSRPIFGVVLESAWVRFHHRVSNIGKTLMHSVSSTSAFLFRH